MVSIKSLSKWFGYGIFSAGILLGANAYGATVNDLVNHDNGRWTKKELRENYKFRFAKKGERIPGWGSIREAKLTGDNSVEMRVKPAHVKDNRAAILWVDTNNNMWPDQAIIQGLESDGSSKLTTEDGELNNGYQLGFFETNKDNNTLTYLASINKIKGKKSSSSSLTEKVSDKSAIKECPSCDESKELKALRAQAKEAEKINVDLEQRVSSAEKSAADCEKRFEEAGKVTPAPIVEREKRQPFKKFKENLEKLKIKKVSKEIPPYSLSITKKGLAPESYPVEGQEEDLVRVYDVEPGIHKVRSAEAKSLEKIIHTVDGKTKSKKIRLIGGQAYTIIPEDASVVEFKELGVDDNDGLRAATDKLLPVDVYVDNNLLSKEELSDEVVLTNGQSLRVEENKPYDLMHDEKEITATLNDNPVEFNEDLILDCDGRLLINYWAHSKKDKGTISIEVKGGEPKKLEQKVEEIIIEPKVEEIKEKDIGLEIIEEAESYLGTPYKFGGTTPRAFDCSGFVQYVYEKKGLDIPRASRSQFKYGESVGEGELLPGDLVFFDTTRKKRGVDHLGIYKGNGEFIHASVSGVKISNLDSGYYQRKYAGARRVIEQEKEQENIPAPIPAPEIIEVAALPSDYLEGDAKTDIGSIRFRIECVDGTCEQIESPKKERKRFGLFGRAKGEKRERPSRLDKKEKSKFNLNTSYLRNNAESEIKGFGFKDSYSGQYDTTNLEAALEVPEFGVIGIDLSLTSGEMNKSSVNVSEKSFRYGIIYDTHLDEFLNGTDIFAAGSIEDKTSEVKFYGIKLDQDTTTTVYTLDSRSPYLFDAGIGMVGFNVGGVLSEIDIDQKNLDEKYRELYGYGGAILTMDNGLVTEIYISQEQKHLIKSDTTIMGNKLGLLAEYTTNNGKNILGGLVEFPVSGDLENQGILLRYDTRFGDNNKYFVGLTAGQNNISYEDRKAGTDFSDNDGYFGVQVGLGEPIKPLQIQAYEMQR